MSQKGKLTVSQSTKVRFIAKTKVSKKPGKDSNEKLQKKLSKDTKQDISEVGQSTAVQKDVPASTNSNRIDDLKKAFALFDKDGDGCICKDEVMQVLSSAGVQFTADQLNMFMSKLDKDGDGEVDYDEFCNLMKDVVFTTQTQKHVCEAFKAIDVDCDGTITKKELQQAIGQFGGSLTDNEADDVMLLADRNGDGEIDYEEFVTLLYLLDIQPPTDD